MLRSELDAYLQTIKERELDVPFLLLLASMGFYDIHYVHGSVEFGKDFIAKKHQEDGIIQYVFQTKAGDISLGKWRNDIYGQLLEAATSSLSHPNFDTKIPTQTVLATTGDLHGNVKLLFQHMNDSILSKLHKRPIIFWGKQNLLDFIVDYGLYGVHQAATTHEEVSGSFFHIYGLALDGTLSARDVESYSHNWIRTLSSTKRHLLRYAVECEMVAKQCVLQRRHYVAATCHLALLRALFAASYRSEVPVAHEAYAQILTNLHEISAQYVNELEVKWRNSSNLLELGSFHMNTYLVHCARILELISLAYFSTAEAKVRTNLADFLEDFATREPGCSHPLSDRYAVSVVAAVLVLQDAGKPNVAQELIKGTAVWVCDRYEQGIGLASANADALEEAKILFGYAFEFISPDEHNASFLSTALIDLAAFLGNEVLYADVANDFNACNILSPYWQMEDTVELFTREAEDARQYSSIDYRDSLSGVAVYEYSNHINLELKTYRFVDKFGPVAILPIMLLMRDRYFPTIWTSLTQ